MSRFASSSSMKTKKKETMVDGTSNCKSLPPLMNVSAMATEEEEGEMVQWLHVLLRTKFWEPCSRKHTTGNNRAGRCIFCIKCYKVLCPHCTHHKSGHRLLKIRRYVYRSLVLTKDMHELNIDVSRIQTYIINGKKGVHLRPVRRSPHFRPQPGSPRCLTCSCWLPTTPNLFCSLTCKGKANISQDDFSGPEAEHRYRSLKAHMALPPPTSLMNEPEPELEPEADPEHESELELELEQEATPKAESKLEHELEQKGEPELEPKVEPEPELELEPKVELELKLEPKDEPEPELEYELKPKHEPEFELDHEAGHEVELFAAEPIYALPMVNSYPLNGPFRKRPRKQVEPERLNQ
ncbi:hypothetical protein EJB05_07123, partial [Eragrostis curvula]